MATITMFKHKFLHLLQLASTHDGLCHGPTIHQIVIPLSQSLDFDMPSEIFLWFETLGLAREFLTRASEKCVLFSVPGEKTLDDFMTSTEGEYRLKCKMCPSEARVGDPFGVSDQIKLNGTCLEVKLEIRIAVGAVKPAPTGLDTDRLMAIVTQDQNIRWVTDRRMLRPAYLLDPKFVTAQAALAIKLLDSLKNKRGVVEPWCSSAALTPELLTCPKIRRSILDRLEEGFDLEFDGIHLEPFYRALRSGSVETLFDVLICIKDQFGTKSTPLDSDLEIRIP